jgi:predicted ribosomally synthesized peptide with SipW-like signal peptide
MNSKNKRKPLIMIGAVVLALITVISATYAWFTANDEVTNKLKTQDALALVKIKETFVEPDDWKPGQTVTKEVGVVDTGSAPALARIYFKELLTVNQPADGESAAFNAAMESAKKKPVLFDNTPYTGADWFEVTTAPNAAKGNIKLAADYSPVKVYAKYVTADESGSSLGSYSFAMWAPISGTAFDGELQAVNYDREFTYGRPPHDDSTEKTLTLSNIEYMTYQGELSASADWTVDKPAALDMDKSVAESKINALAEVAGKYPNNIQLNYANVTDTPTAGKWYYNADDGYFYYIGRVEPGTATDPMLDSLLLKSDAGSDYYSNMTFDLMVEMDALQHTKDAIAAQWPTVANNSALKTALEAFCES